MVVVVPPLPEHEHGDEPVVPRLVPGAEVAPPEHVADRVHREGGVLVGEDPDEPAPDQPGEARAERPADEVPSGERDAEAEHDPEEVHAVDRPHEPVLVQVAAVLATLLHDRGS